jgi:hypothetical protein
VKHLLKIASMIILWFSVGVAGLLITFVYNIWVGGFFVALVYWLWIWGIKELIKWYDS